LQNAVNGDKKEIENAKRVMIPWLKHVVNESAEDQIDGGIKNNLLDPKFKDKNSNLYRLYLSVTYSLKDYIKSTVSILESLQGCGIDKGILGISVFDRAKLISDSAPIVGLNTSSMIGYNLSGFVADPILPLPMFSNWYFDSKVKDVLSPAAIKVSKHLVQNH
jgi:hypothetical protein